MTLQRFGLKTVLAGALIAVLATGAGAAVYTWDGTANGTTPSANDNFNTGDNWVGNYATNGAGHEYVFSDADFRSVVDANTGTQWNIDLGKFTFTGDAFQFINSGTKGVRLFGLNSSALEMATSSTITFSGYTTTFKNAITGTGTGKLVFNGAVSFDGSTAISTSATTIFNNAGGNGAGANRFLTITNGTLLVNNTSGSGVGLAAVNVNSGTLGGNGMFATGDATNTANTTIAAGARLSPGNNGYDALSDTGTLTFAYVHTNGKLVLQDGALFTFDLAAPSASDKVAVTAGTLALNSQEFDDFTFNTLAGFAPGTYTLFESVATTGSLGSNLTGKVGGYDASLKLDGNNIVLNVVPEPATMCLLALGSVAAIVRRRR